MDYDLLLKDAESFVSKYMRKHENPKLLFHNLATTQNVVSVADQIAQHYSLNERELFIVRAAAWFLYVGYYKIPATPEESSAEIAAEFFTNSGVESEIVDAIKQCILATAHYDSPANIPASIVRDADTFYLGFENFPSCDKLRRKEFSQLNKSNIDKSEWKRKTIRELEAHQYFTDYAKSRMELNVQGHLKRLKKKNPLLAQDSRLPFAASAEQSSPGVISESGKEKSKAHKNDSSARTIETMFRTTSANSQRLSSQADTKAHIMISVNTIIISLMLGLRQLAQSSSLTVPVVVLLIVNLVTIVFSILATRPNIAKRKFTGEDFEQNNVNLLFFGNFYSLDFGSYSSAMLNIMDDKQALHITMLRNLYEQGAVLAKKYKMLKISYNVFMYGLILSVIFFLLAPKIF